MKIGYLVQQFPPEVGAGPARVTEMALRWRDTGAEVTVMTGMPNRPEGRIHPEYRGKFAVTEDWEGIRVLRSWLYANPKHGFARTIANNATFMLTSVLNAAFRGGRPDVLIASSPPFFPHISGLLLSRAWRVPLVLEVRDLWPDYLVGMGVLRADSRATRALFGLERYLLRSAQHTVVVTESFRERIVDKGVEHAAIDVIPNGVDTAQYHASDEAPPIAELRPAPGEFVVGYLGNMGAGQGLTTVIEAAAILATAAPSVRFVLAGDGPEKSHLLGRLRELSLSNVSIHPPIAKEQTRAFYNACGICLVPLAPFPILQETIPSKIFEVMACERPLIACLGGEGARIVRESRGGLVSPPGDAESLASTIGRVRSMPAEERAAMGQRARAYVQMNYSRETLADRYFEILERLATRRFRGRTETNAQEIAA